MPYVVETRTKRVDSVPFTPKIVVDNTRSSNAESKAKEKTPTLINAFRELYLFSTREQQRAFLHHQLEAITKEHHLKPFHSLVLNINNLESPNTSVHDPLYAHSNLLERCYLAVDAAQTETERLRYAREADQVENILSLLQTINPVISCNPIGVIDYLLDTTQDKNLIPQYEGWYLDTVSSAISAQAATKVRIDPTEQVLLGPKQLYIMPQSTVHAGWKSMYLLAQPAYIPSQKRWVLLQEQHMAEFSWDRHLMFISRVTNQEQPQTQEDFEPFVMSELIQLDDLHQHRSLQGSLKQLLYTEHTDIFGQFVDTSKNIHSLLDTLPTHIEYLLDIFSLDETWEAGWSEQKAERLFQAFFNTLSSLMQNVSITKQTTKSWYAEYKKIYDNPFTRKQAHAQREALRKASMKVPGGKHLGNPLLSQIECLTFSVKGLDFKNIDIAAISSGGMKGFLPYQVEELSNEQKVLLKEKLAQEYVRKVLHGQVWYIHVDVADQYTEANCTLHEGKIIGMCGVPLEYDNYCLSEEQYLALVAAAEAHDDLTTLRKTLMYGAKNPQELEFVLWVLSELERSIKSTVNITELLNNDIVNTHRSAVISELLMAADPLTILKDPSFIPRLLPSTTYKDVTPSSPTVVYQHPVALAA